MGTDVNPQIDERRDAPRVELEEHYSVRVDPCDGREPVVCMMMDFSVTGFRLRVPAGAVLPQDVQVLIGDLAHNACVVWRKGDVVGVDLVDEHHSIY
jgi:hypothetical protein